MRKIILTTILALLMCSCAEKRREKVIVSELGRFVVEEVIPVDNDESIYKVIPIDTVFSADVYIYDRPQEHQEGDTIYLYR